VDYLGSPVINVVRLPISWTSSAAQWFQVPIVSMATGYYCYYHTSYCTLHHTSQP